MEMPEVVKAPQGPAAESTSARKVVAVLLVVLGALVLVPVLIFLARMLYLNVLA